MVSETMDDRAVFSGEDQLAAVEPPDEDDAEALLDELIEAMVTPEEAAMEASEASPRDLAPRSQRGNEFTCSSCHLIVSRSCLVDEERAICRDCYLRNSPEPPREPHRFERSTSAG
jgi:hypothetical protein